MRSEDLFEYHRYLSPIVEEDVRYLKEKDASYGASWKLGGGRSAWFMLRRKMDRMIQMMRRPEIPEGWSKEDIARELRSGSLEHLAEKLAQIVSSEDIFAKIAEDVSGQDGTVLAEVRDLRRYLLLVEAEMTARAAKPTSRGSKRRWLGSDGMEHPFGYDAEEYDAEEESA